ncbi:O-antigen ligase [Caulobacter sp. UNC279MFTsu5.1]|uniref:O-antigen ligase family protein n=1 Tax=Caulobacter sp. UNC279MFTsu5.1 TaxID=1502775 RepID=UPI0008DEFAD0|nr:O-antigen ligase [Caulobacter sp. UNC279MFTsu5.1]SFK72434.1 O-antigen ligase [Caulobacter sp. UNC279MFTsu5.1]
MADAEHQQAERPDLWRKLEALACGFVLFMLSNALIGPLLDPLQAGGENIPVLRLMWLPVYALILGLAVWRAPRLMRFWLPALMLSLLIFWVYASASWSLNPATTNRRALAAAFTTLFGLYFASSFDGRRMAEIIAVTFLLLAAAGLLAAVAYPKMGVQHDINAGDWRGLWYEKNQMGAMMVYGALAAMAALLAGSTRRKQMVFTIVLCAAMLLMSKSKTSLLALMIGLCGSMLLAAMRRGPATAVIVVWLGVTVAVTAAMVMWLAPELLFKALGKDPSLTGRTDIWAALLRQSAKHPLTGYGYGVFWTLDSVPANWIRKETGWLVPSAHNGWLDILAQLGWIGVGLCALVLGGPLLVALFRFRRVQDGYWATLFLAIFLMTTFSESFILERNGIVWALACAAVTRLLGPVWAPGAPSEKAARRPLVAAPPLAWSLASADPEPEIWTPASARRPAFAPTFGKRTVSPFGA